VDEMREIITLEQANRLFLALAIAAPLVGPGLGALVGWRNGSISRGVKWGLGIGLLGPLNLLLWLTYNRITERLGLDTVANLLVNLGLFLALGVIAGLIAGRYMRPSPTLTAEDESGREPAIPEHLNA